MVMVNIFGYNTSIDKTNYIPSMKKVCKANYSPHATASAVVSVQPSPLRHRFRRYLHAAPPWAAYMTKHAVTNATAGTDNYSTTYSSSNRIVPHGRTVHTIASF